LTPSLGSYIGGCLATIGIVAALALGAYWLRRWIVPEFSGALARLADATLAVALLILALQLLGSLEILTVGWTIIVCIAIGLGAAALGWMMAPSQEREVGAPQVQTAALLIALGVASWVVAEWTFPSQLGGRSSCVSRSPAPTGTSRTPRPRSSASRSTPSRCRTTAA
jgi:hypothetical protein